jgi:UPF0271 protein
MGEQLLPDPDKLVMPLIDLANIACGGHAGTSDSIAKTLSLAKQHGILIGAHPAYPDRENFGRKKVTLPWQNLAKSLSEQVAHFPDQQLHHIKPHGALYLEMMRDEALFLNLLAWMKEIAPNSFLVIQSSIKPNYRSLAKQAGVPILLEAFADRGYLESGELMPRSQPNSLYQDAQQIVAQFQRLSQQGEIDTICFHSDNPASIKALEMINNA